MWPTKNGRFPHMRQPYGNLSSSSSKSQLWSSCGIFLSDVICLPYLVVKHQQLSLPESRRHTVLLVSNVWNGLQAACLDPHLVNIYYFKYYPLLKNSDMTLNMSMDIHIPSFWDIYCVIRDIKIRNPDISWQRRCRIGYCKNGKHRDIDMVVEEVLKPLVRIIADHTPNRDVCRKERMNGWRKSE